MSWPDELSIERNICNLNSGLIDGQCCTDEGSNRWYEIFLSFHLILSYFKISGSSSTHFFVSLMGRRSSPLIGEFSVLSNSMRIKLLRKTVDDTYTCFHAIYRQWRLFRRLYQLEP